MRFRYIADTTAQVEDLKSEIPEVYPSIFEYLFCPIQWTAMKELNKLSIY